MPPTRPCTAQLNDTRSDLAGSRELSEYKEESETNSSKSLVQEGARVQLKKYFAHIHAMGKTSAELATLGAVGTNRLATIFMCLGAGYKACCRQQHCTCLSMWPFGLLLWHCRALYLQMQKVFQPREASNYRCFWRLLHRGGQVLSWSHRPCAAGGLCPCADGKNRVCPIVR